MLCIARLFPCYRSVLRYQSANGRSNCKKYFLYEYLDVDQILYFLEFFLVFKIVRKTTSFEWRIITKSSDFLTILKNNKKSIKI
jgi:hypothetical protein